ncbi:MAG TPA: STAS domain-containing protein [Streptosporangiaceae bacterium]|nr:STAS domain-containing protein [Streptosporangiaceae bacterium]
MADLDRSEQNAPSAEAREEDGITVIVLAGDLDMTNVKHVSAVVDAALDGRPRTLILDASGLTYMDSSGVALMAQTTRLFQAVQVRNPTPIVRRLLELTGLSQILQIIDENQP